MSEQIWVQLDTDNKVIRVAVVQKDFLDANPDRYGDPQNWVQTYSTDPNKTYAGIGYTYDAALDEFVAPPLPEPVPGA